MTLPYGQNRACLGTQARPACHPEPKAKDLALQGSPHGTPAHELLRLRPRMTNGPRLSGGVRKTVFTSFTKKKGTAFVQKAVPFITGSLSFYCISNIAYGIFKIKYAGEEI